MEAKILDGTSPEEVIVCCTIIEAKQNAVRSPPQLHRPPTLSQIYSPFSITSSNVAIKKKLWAKIQTWYLAGFFFTCITFLQNLHYNNSSILLFFKRGSFNAQSFFFAINLFLILILLSHLAYIFLTGLAKRSHSWPVEKSSLNFFVFLTMYEMFSIIFVAFFCFPDEKSYNWMTAPHMAERDKRGILMLHHLHEVQLDESCCGFKDFRDYFHYPEYFHKTGTHKIQYSIPPSCCSKSPCVSMAYQPKNLTAFSRGCSPIISHYVHGYGLATSMSFFVLAAIQSFIVTSAFKLKRLYSEKNDKFMFIEQANHPTFPTKPQYV